MKQIDKNHKYSQKIYDRYLKEHGNVSTIEPEGNFSVVWYYTYNGESYTYRYDLSE